MGEEARECAKCGAELPSGDEGICEVCGTAFGFRTSVMPIVTAAHIAEARAAGSSQAIPAPAVRSAQPARFLLVALLAAAAVLAAVLVAILAS